MRTQPASVGRVEVHRLHCFAAVHQALQMQQKLYQLCASQQGIFFDPSSADEVESAYEDITSRTIMTLHQELEALIINIEQLRIENKHLKAQLEASEMAHRLDKEMKGWYPSKIFLWLASFVPF
ncbi:hypothetical protein Leryth_019185 [Lithospermum erythrorhizon]|nr:hypothetical protein Leryth_019185 [Lithospermum erythrorhizon]